MSGTSRSAQALPGSADPERCATLEALSARFRRPLRRYFEKRAIPRDELDDLVQDVFVRLAARAGLDPPEHVEAYVFKLASNLLRDRHRRLSARAAGQHEAYEEDIHGSAHATFGPERLLHGAQGLEQLVAALYELPERTRAVFTLYHLEELSHQEIARRLGIAVSTIEKHMARANTHLLKRIER